MNANTELLLAETYCEENIVDCCKELVKLSHTGLLPAGKVRILASMLVSLSGRDSQTMAINMVKLHAVRKISSLK